MAEVPQETLARLAARQRLQTQAASSGIRDGQALLAANDADLTALGISSGPAKPYNGGMLWTLSKCPFSVDHTDGAFRILYPDGGIHIGCHHNRCRDKTIKNAPELFPSTTSLFRDAQSSGNTETSSRPSPDVATSDRVPILLPLTEVTEKSIDWLWQGWLARTMLTILGGYAGDGKSTLTMDLIARLTAGGALPDGTSAPLVNVLILAAKDDPEYAIKPRLRVHGADMSRVFILTKGRRCGGWKSRMVQPSPRHRCDA